jgi:hypothetical protein
MRPEEMDRPQAGSRMRTLEKVRNPVKDLVLNAASLRPSIAGAPQFAAERNYVLMET